MYLEVLVESGLIGFVIFLALAIIILMKLIRSKKFLNYFLFCLIISFIFPFKPTGSIFSTITASLYWFILSLPIAFEKYEMKKINND
jgi:O-antigen ligase